MPEILTPPSQTMPFVRSGMVIPTWAVRYGRRKVPFSGLIAVAANGAVVLLTVPPKYRWTLRGLVVGRSGGTFDQASLDIFDVNLQQAFVLSLSNYNYLNSSMNFDLEAGDAIRTTVTNFALGGNVYAQAWIIEEPLD